MGYYNAIYNDLRDLSEDKETFAFLTETLKSYSKGSKHRPAGEEVRPYWFEIMEFMIYRHTKCGEYIRDFPKFFYQKDHLQILDNLGIDYNYIDNSGKNFFLYYLYSQNNSTYNKDFKFNESLEKEIVKRTANPYLIDGSGQHALFHKTTILAGGLDASNFIEFHQQFPDLDLHLIDTSGNNLLNYALMGSNISLAQHLIANNISIHHVNEKNNTVLFPFIFLAPISDNKRLFQQLVQHVDISQKDKNNETVLDTLFSWSDLDSKLATETRSKSRDWIAVFCESVNNQSIFLNNDSAKILLEVMQQHKKSYFDSCQHANKSDYIHLFKKAFSALQYQLFNNIIPHANEDEGSSMKIKI
jgi:hypothetical protein